MLITKTFTNQPSYTTENIDIQNNYKLLKINYCGYENDNSH